LAHVYKDRNIFYSGRKHFKLRLGIWTLNLQVKENMLDTETDFWRRAAMTSRLLKVRNEVMREKMHVTQTILERLDNNMFKWSGRVIRMEDNRWPKGIMTWSPEGRRRRGRPEVGKGSGKGYVEQNNLTCDEAVNRQLWQPKNQ